VLLRARVRACLERRSLQADLESALAETRAVLDISPVPTFFLKQLKVMWMNTMGEQLLGYKSSEMIGKATDYLHLNAEDYSHMMAKADNVVKTGAVFRADVHMRRKDGKLILARCAAKAIAPWDLTRGVVWVVEDVTEQRADAARIAFLAHHDQLTGLPNRILLADRMRVAIAHAIRNRVSCGVMFLDLDKFKTINDTLGHAIGDELLVEVSRRLKACVRDSDTVARIGGDEFVVVLPGLKTVEDAEVVAKKIQLALTAPYGLSGNEVRTSPSVGISLFPADAMEADTLVKCADEAMYEAKQAGRNGYRFYRKTE
jgi:diguanylate cyclase (GGDEF)-like protein/PAS domain S-box-containing protein